MTIVQHIKIFNVFLIPKLFFLFINLNLYCQEAFWYQTNGVNGGNVWDLTMTSSGRLLAVSENGYIYSSDDTAKSWKITYGYFTENFLFRIASNSKSEIVAAGLYGRTVRSSDNGQTWTSPISPLNTQSVHSIALDDSGFVYAGTSEGYFISRNLGVSWTLDTVIHEPVVKTLIFSDTLLMAFSYSGIYSSHDKGRSWMQLHTMSVTVAACNKKNDVIIFSDNGVQRSTDFGKNWNVVGAPTLTGNPQSVGTNENGDIVAGVFAKGIYLYSTESFQWKQVAPNVNTSNSFIFIDSMTIIAGTRSRAIFRSDNAGKAWYPSSRGIIGTTVKTMSTGSTSVILAAADLDGLYSSTDYGSSWNYVGFENQRFGKVELMSDGSYLVSVLDELYILPIGSNQWSKVQYISTTNSNFTTDDSGYIYTIDKAHQVIRSSDKGTSWSSLPVTDCYYLTTDYNKRIWAYSQSLLKYSTNHGASWFTLPSSISFFDLKAVVSRNDTIIFASANGVARSIDFGATWLEIGKNIIYAHSLFLAQNGEIYATGSNYGVLHFVDSTKNWEYLNDGMIGDNTYSIVLDSLDHLLVSTDYNGIYRSTNRLTEKKSVAEAKYEDITPSDLVISPIYPNPFNPTATISLNLEEDQKVVVKIYNEIGQPVCELFNGIVKRGRQKINIKLNSVSSGNYYCELRSIKWRKILKFILIK